MTVTPFVATHQTPLNEVNVMPHIRSIVIVIFVVGTVLWGASSVQVLSEDLEGRRHFSELLMNGTYLVVGNEGGSGTAFVVQCDTTGVVYIVTAKHVFVEMPGDTVSIFLRSMQSDGTYSKHIHRFPIRDQGRTLYYTHYRDSVDVAVLPLMGPIPSDIVDVMQPIPKSFIASDYEVRKYWIHPGDRLFFLGFPLGVRASEASFPFLRQGFVSSYPLLPLDRYPFLYFDGQVFEGNSGGPIYFEYFPSSWNNRTVNQKGMIVGLVHGYPHEKYRRKIDSIARDHDLGMGAFVNSGFIREVLDSAGCR